jgi:flagellar protein FliO/FliZ
MLFGLALVVGVILAFAWVLRRLGRVPGASSGVVRILGGASLGPRERVVLIEVGRTQLLVGLAPGRVQTLHVLDEPVDIKPGHGPSAAAGFAERLSAMLRDRRSS